MADKLLDTGHHDRRLARRLEDPSFRAEFASEVLALIRARALDAEESTLRAYVLAVTSHVATAS
jgi:hypothetical protein